MSRVSGASNRALEAHPGCARDDPSLPSMNHVVPSKGIPFPIRTLDFGDAEAAANLLRNGAAAAAPGNSEADESPRAQA